MKQLVFATRNRGKLVELRDLFSDVSGIEVLSVDDAARVIGRDIPDVIEDADTFIGNATKKAREVSAITGLPSLADDSGLEVDALDGAPGVYSARYAGEPHDDARNNAKLLAALEGIPASQRTARFRAVLVLADIRGRLGEAVISADGVCEGTIITELRGSHGFGYDPLFYCAELGGTFGGEVGLAQKAEHSHRARAMHAIKPALVEYLSR